MHRGRERERTVGTGPSAPVPPESARRNARAAVAPPLCAPAGGAGSGLQVGPLGRRVGCARTSPGVPCARPAAAGLAAALRFDLEGSECTPCSVVHTAGPMFVPLHA